MSCSDVSEVKRYSTRSAPPPRILLIGSSDRDLERLMIRYVGLRNRVREGDLLEPEIYGEETKLDHPDQNPFQPPVWKFTDAIAGSVCNKGLFIHVLRLVDWPRSLMMLYLIAEPVVGFLFSLHGSSFQFDI
jgi:hypothetical protein